MTATATKSRPILFSAPMVLAILSGAKTMTRRIIRDDWWRCLDPDEEADRVQAVAQCPHGKVGDVLWCKETWRPEQFDSNGGFKITYAADDYCRWFNAEEIPDGWHEPKAATRGNVSPLFMPRWASRITLEITDVRVERLQEISEADAAAEGVDWNTGPLRYGHTNAVSAFRELWNKINGPESWDANPWVWVISFRRLQCSS